jgi:hypothetical protein
MRSIRMTSLLILMAAAPVAAQQAARTPAPPAEMKGQPSPQGFSVVLVLGALNSGSNADASVPPAARKALNDMKDFLPYKGYRLLDAEWILGSRGATTRLRGADGQDYELRLSGGMPMAGRMRVSFQLVDGGGDAVPMLTARTAERAALEQRLRDLQNELAATRDRSGDKAQNIKEREAQIAELKRRLDGGDATPMAFITRGRHIIDTSFDMEIGETVVVGTSRLKDGKDGGKALIALLTAVPKSGAATKQE